MIIRDANENDIGGMLGIYAPFITDSMVTFESEIPSSGEFNERMLNYQKYFPWLVAETNGTVSGYAYASKYRERIAYQWVSEVSIYLHPASKGRGVAKKLYGALFMILALQGIFKVYAVISLPNPQSVGFHEKMGFKYFATYKNVGNKFGQWSDVGWWERELKRPAKNPVAPVNYPDLSRQEVEKILQKYSR